MIKNFNIFWKKYQRLKKFCPEKSGIAPVPDRWSIHVPDWLILGTPRPFLWINILISFFIGSISQTNSHPQILQQISTHCPLLEHFSFGILHHTERWDCAFLLILVGKNYSQGTFPTVTRNFHTPFWSFYITWAQIMEILNKNLI